MTGWPVQYADPAGLAFGSGRPSSHGLRALRRVCREGRPPGPVPSVIACCYRGAGGLPGALIGPGEPPRASMSHRPRPIFNRLSA